MRTRKLCGEEIGMRNKVTVSIGGKEYTMVASEDEGYVRKCAALVDRQLGEVSSGGKLARPPSAVMASTTACPFSARRPHTITWAPSAA